MKYRIGFAAILIACTLTCRWTGAAPAIGPVAKSGGLAVLVNPATAETHAELKLSPRFMVHCLTDDKVLAAELQKGSTARFSAEHWQLRELPHAENLVNLLIVYKADSVPADEIYRVLAPLGVAWISSGRKPDLLKAGLEIAGESGDGWLQLRKGWPREIDEWTHFMHGADGNGVMLWNRPIARWGWEAWSDKPVAGHGRFTQPPHIARTLVADGDIVYVTLGFGSAVSAIDGRTGEIIRAYAGTQNTDEILVEDGRLYLAVHDQSLEQRTTSALNWRREGNELPPATKRMVAVDPESGRILWESGSHVGISEKQQFMEIHRHLNPVLGDGKVFFATKAELVCLSAETGEELWRGGNHYRQLGVQLQCLSQAGNGHRFL